VGADGTYIHFADGAAAVTLAPSSAAQSANAPLPYIAVANGYVRQFKRTAHGMAFEFGGYYQPFVELANAGTCSVQVAGRPAAVQRDGALLRFEAPASASLQMNYQPVEVNCAR
jgi:hypothetical protein